MGSFVKALQKEDISGHKNRDTIREVRHKARLINQKLCFYNKETVHSILLCYMMD